MITTQELLERLRKGEDAEAIAKELVDTLNGALDQHKAEEEAKAAAAKKAAEVRTNKIEDMEEILDLIYDFWLEYYCDTNEDIDNLDKIFDEIKPEEVVDSLEELGKWAFELDKSMKSFENILGKPTLFNGKPIKVAMAKDAADADKIISNFLKNMGL